LDGGLRGAVGNSELSCVTKVSITCWSAVRRYSGRPSDALHGSMNRSTSMTVASRRSWIFLRPPDGDLQEVADIAGIHLAHAKSAYQAEQVVETAPGGNCVAGAGRHGTIYFG